MAGRFDLIENYCDRGIPMPGRVYLDGRIPMIEIPCSVCGNLFTRRIGVFVVAKKFYCSRACWIFDIRGERSHHWKGGPEASIIRLVPVSICKLCGAEFRKSSNSKGWFCSPPCRNKARAKYPTVHHQRAEQWRRRYARERAGREIAHHTHEQWVALLERYKHRCASCRRKIPLVRDHIIPLSKGGSDDITNIQPLCTSCNSRKSNRRTQLL